MEFCCVNNFVKNNLQESTLILTYKTRINILLIYKKGLLKIFIGTKILLFKPMF